jgi:nucleoside-diphosphate-sugar epimerase
MNTLRKILVTGGSGFVGSWMRKTEPAGLDVMYLNRNGYNLWYWWNVHWDAIVHLAPISPFQVIGTAMKFNSRVLYCSSGAVYHPENDTKYRQNKIDWEKFCIESWPDTVVARLFTFCGEGLDDGKAIVQFEKRAKAGEPLEIWGDGKTVRSYMHGAEMGRWMWAILMRGVKGEAYDVGSDEPVTMLELAKRYSDNIIIKGGADPVPHYLPPNTAKTKGLLNE